MQVQVSYNKKEAKTYNASRTTTVKELIDMVKADYNVPNANISAVLNGFKLKPSEKLSQISLKEGNIIQMYVEAAASAQPVRKRLCIPRRTDIDAEMKAPPDLENRISQLQNLFGSPDQAPDRETIITALENSYYNMDRAVDYLFPPNERNESPLNDQQKKDIIQLTRLGYTPGTAIQVYFACDKQLEPALKLIVSLEKEVDVKETPKPETNP